MSLSAEQLSKYGLTKTSASAADHDKGIVAHGSGFYQIQGFGHGQEDKLDKDKGKTFSSSLEADAKAIDSTYDPSTFNTAGDVENALRRIESGGGGSTTTKDEKVQLSKRAGEALAGVETYQDWRAGTGKSGFGNETDLIFGSSKEQLAANQKFADDYKLNLKKHLTPGKAEGYAGAGEMTDRNDPSDIAKKIVGKAKKEL